MTRILFVISDQIYRHSEGKQAPPFSSQMCKLSWLRLIQVETKQIGPNASLCRINVFMGPESTKEMMTGVHVVSDIYCIQCSVVIGWTYVSKLPQ